MPDDDDWSGNIERRLEHFGLGAGIFLKASKVNSAQKTNAKKSPARKLKKNLSNQPKLMRSEMESLFSSSTAIFPVVRIEPQTA